MSRLFPHPPYAEDQPYAHTILTLHVLSRGFSVGALGGAATHGLRRIFRPSPALSLLRSAGTGSVVGTALLALALAGRMRGREGIEWRDRSWRLLANRGQAETDEWWAAGAVIGAVGGGTAGRGALGGGGFRSVLGGAGLGSLVGMVGQAVWRNGVLGGFKEEEARL